MIDVLAVGPHPDDIELSAGGTVAGLSAAGKTVVLVDMTRGERATRGTPEIRDQEAQAAADALGVGERICLGLPDGAVSARNPDHLHAVVEVVRRYRPRILIGMHWNDDHPDHVEGGELVRRGAYMAGLRNFPERDHEPHRPQRILFAMGRRPFTPSLVVDVTGSYESKRLALAAFASQFNRPPDDPRATPISEPGFLPMLESRDRYYGGMIGATFGEPFFEPGPGAVRHPSALMGEEAS